MNVLDRFVVQVHEGEKGERGRRGEKGEPGIPGRDGRSGKDGRDGIDGKDGAPGRDGKDGLRGPPGKDGEDGQDAIALVPAVATFERDLLTRKTIRVLILKDGKGLQLTPERDSFGVMVSVQIKEYP